MASEVVELELLDHNWLRRFRRNLRAWFRKHARDLPWRRNPDPYRIWISEVMLQQTTVAAVIPFFERFLERFPTVHELAKASESEVLRYWEGLGYYNRARNIHRTARQLVAESDGRFPSDVCTLQKLPGIGRYTAGAIASFAFDRRAPIVEANTLRLYSRLLGYRDDPRSSRGQKTLWAFAEHVLPDQSPGEFNQALMDLGATICSPSDPDCGQCPVRTSCAALAEGAQDEIPLPPPRPQMTDLTEAAIVVVRDGAYLLRRCADGERWAGLWDFPRFSVEETPEKRGQKLNSFAANGDSLPLPVHSLRRLEAATFATTNIHVEIADLLMILRHGVTRYRITLHCYAAKYQSGQFDQSHGEMRWVSPDEMVNYPLCTTGRKIAKFLTRGRADSRQPAKGKLENAERTHS